MNAADVFQVVTGILGLTGGSAVIVQWLKGRSIARASEQSAHVKLQEAWTDTTLELVETLQGQLREALGELGQLRPVLAHLDEALDHLHALLAAIKSDSGPELSAAERRASAFLRRMRGTEKKGEERQAVQRHISAKRIERDAESGKIDE